MQLAHIDKEHKLPGKFCLRYIIFGGEKLKLSGISSWYERYADTQKLVNGYGITECTVFSLFHEIKPYEVYTSEIIPIGLPINCLKVYVLDSQLNPVPIGVEGQIYVSGPALSPGYYNKDALTAERFISNPYSEEKLYQRMYATGDLGYWNKMGHIYYSMRTDKQIQLHGFRIEIDEIESTLNDHSAVKQAVVVLNGSDEDLKIIAYCVARENKKDITVKQLNDYAQEQLQKHMLPAAIVILDKVPMTVNGKLDIDLLPEPIWREQQRNDMVHAESKTEKILLAIWQQELGIDQIGVHDNYFSIGGDSINCLRIVSAAKKQQLSISVSNIFKCQTIRKLANNVGHDQTYIPHLDIDLTKGTVVSFAQQRLFLVEQLNRTPGQYNVPLVNWLVGPINYQALEKAWNKLLVRHESLRTCFQMEG